MADNGYQFFAGTADGYVCGYSASYATAKTTGAYSASDQIAVGQNYQGGMYVFSEGFIAFDTSTLPDTADVRHAVLSLTPVSTAYNHSDAYVQARTHNWGAAMEYADFVAAANLTSKTLLCSTSVQLLVNEQACYFTGGYTELASFCAAVNRTGTTYIMLSDTQMVAEHAPHLGTPNIDQVNFYVAETANTVKDPQLLVYLDPIVVITAPTTTATVKQGSPLTVSWTTTLSAAAGEYTVFLRDPAAVVWYDVSGLIDSNATSFSVACDTSNCPPGSGYTLFVAWRLDGANVYADFNEGTTVNIVRHHRILVPGSKVW